MSWLEKVVTIPGGWYLWPLDPGFLLQVSGDFYPKMQMSPSWQHSIITLLPLTFLCFLFNYFSHEAVTPPPPPTVPLWREIDLRKLKALHLFFPRMKFWEIDKGREKLQGGKTDEEHKAGWYFPPLLSLFFSFYQVTWLEASLITTSTASARGN